MVRSKAAILLALALSGCSSTPSGYAIPLNEAYARLEQADIKGFKLARHCGVIIEFTPHKQPNDAITWTISSSGRKMVEFTVRMTATDPNYTTATIEVPPDKGGGEAYDGTKDYVRPAIHQPLRPAVKELIDAAMEQRAYDVWRIPEPINVNDAVCSVQRAGYESRGMPFSVGDQPGDGPGRSMPGRTVWDGDQD
jgi:hypothetical protein